MREDRITEATPIGTAPIEDALLDAPLSRRGLLGLAARGLWAAGALAVAPRALALGPNQRVAVPLLRYGATWDVHAAAAVTLAEEAALRTSTTMDPAPHALTAVSPAFGRMPFALLSGAGGFSLPDADRQALRRWIELGGLLVADNAGRDAPSPDFDRALRDELGRLFPQRRLERVSPDHVVFRTFYRLDYPAGRALHKPYIEGLPLAGRYAVLLSHNDLLGALDRDASGRYRAQPTPGGERQREMAIRFAVNLLLYGLCLDYKDDQVHLDYLLRKRKWRIRPTRP